jgi:hypothetical protein
LVFATAQLGPTLLVAYMSAAVRALFSARSPRDPALARFLTGLADHTSTATLLLLPALFAGVTLAVRTLRDWTARFVAEADDLRPASRHWTSPHGAPA